MFGSVRPTPYDLCFSIAGIPVRVLPFFWLMAVLLGFQNFHRTNDALLDILYMLAWVGVVFVSILIHELGHALTARMFGYPPSILLYHFGGLAMFEPYRGYTTARAILILLMGPGAGFLLAGLTVGAWNILRIYQVQVAPLASDIYWNLLWVNIAWGLMNLLPVFPLDGGQICREVCLAINPRRGEVWTLVIGIVAGVAVGVAGLMFGVRFMGILFLLMAFQCFTDLQQRRAW